MIVDMSKQENIDKYNPNFRFSPNKIFWYSVSVDNGKTPIKIATGYEGHYSINEYIQYDGCEFFIKSIMVHTNDEHSLWEQHILLKDKYYIEI